MASGFIESTRLYPQRPALFVNSQHISYQLLAQISGRIAATILKHQCTTGHLAAVFAYRSLTSYAAVLGILLSGRGYVPLNPRFPSARTRKMLEQSESDIVVVGRECLSNLEDLLEGSSLPLTIILPEVSADEVAGLESCFSAHRFFPSGRLSSCGDQIPTLPRVAEDDIAYLLFTSGSTGEPKGVPINHRNVRAYIEFVADRYCVQAEDRVSQTFDMTFDLSVHDMFICWERGACLCCIPEAMISTPAKFIRDQQLTLWFSVPSVASFMSRLRLLRPNLFPTLRLSLFCGEALPANLAVEWQASAPHSVIENLYGPTEATIAITAYRWHKTESLSRCRNGITPIGWAFKNQYTCVVDENFGFVSRGEPGELLLSGTQLTAGYWRNPEKTKERFIELRDGSTWYRTGDRAAEESDGCLIYLGRLDDQVKVRGYRVELQEIDSVMRAVCCSDQVVSVAWPVRDGSADGVVGFVCGSSSRDENEIIQRCREFLPDHMVPRAIRFIEDMPRNSNGKIDRHKLAIALDENHNE